MKQITPLNRSICGVDLYVSTDDPAKIAKVKAKLDALVKASQTPKPSQGATDVRSIMDGFFDPLRKRR